MVPLVLLWLPLVSPPSSLLGALRHIPLGVGVIPDCFVFVLSTLLAIATFNVPMSGAANHHSVSSCLLMHSQPFLSL